MKIKYEETEAEFQHQNSREFTAWAILNRYNYPWSQEIYHTAQEAWESLDQYWGKDIPEGIIVAKVLVQVKPYDWNQKRKQPITLMKAVREA